MLREMFFLCKLGDELPWNDTITQGIDTSDGLDKFYTTLKINNTTPHTFIGLMALNHHRTWELLWLGSAIYPFTTVFCYQLLKRPNFLE